MLKDSGYALRSHPSQSVVHIYNICYILIMVWLIIEILKDMNYYLIADNNDKLDKELANGIELFSSIMIEILILFIIISLYIKRLFRFNVDIRLFSKQIAKDKDINLEAVAIINNKLIKLTILSIFEGIGSLILKIIYFIMFFQNSSNIITTFIWIIYWSVYCIMNSICVFWSFEFAQCCYRCSCYCCHRCCIDYCSHCAKRVIVQLKLRQRLMANQT